jgi:hypothetical protein
MIAQIVFKFGACGLDKLFHYPRISAFTDTVPELLRCWRLLGTEVAKNFPRKGVMGTAFSCLIAFNLGIL